MFEKETGEIMSINLIKPKFFTVKLSYCGVDTINGSYKKFQSTNGLKLLYNTTSVISKDFVREANGDLLYDLALTILSTLKPIDKKQLIIDLEKCEKEKCDHLCKKWEILK
jgi:hypothetical protein